MSVSVTSVADTNASTALLAANENRKGASIYNDSTVTLYVLLSDGTASSSNYSVKLIADDFYELPVMQDGNVYKGRIAGIWASDASGAAKITEFS